MVKFILDRPGAPWDYPTLGFTADADGAILDGTLFDPDLEIPPDPYWSVYGGGSAETNITRYASPAPEYLNPVPETTAGWLLAYDTDANTFVPSDPADLVATPAWDAGIAAAVADSGSDTAAALSASYAALYFTDVKANHGAVGNGSTDDTAAFTAARASGAKNVHVPPGTYVIDGLALSQSNQAWHLDPGVTLKAKTGGSQTVATITGNNVALIGGPQVTIDGNSVGSSAGSTIYVNAGTDCVLEGLALTNLAGYGMNVQGNRPTVRRCTVTNPGNYAIFVAAPTTGADITQVLIESNVVTASGNVNGIHVRGNTPAAATGARVVNNVVTLPAAAAAGICIEVWGLAHKATVSGNVTTGGSMGISVSSSNECSVTGNTVTGAYSNGIESAASTGTTIAGNTVDGNAVTDRGIAVTNTGGGGHAITGNTVRNLAAAGAEGIYVSGTAGQNVAIAGNRVHALAPVYIANGYGWAVTGNVFKGTGSTTQAVALDTCTDGNVSNNVCDATGYAANTFGGGKERIIIGPNVLSGGTTDELINGPLGTGGRIV